MDGMRPGRRVLYAGGHVDGSVADAVPRRWWVSVGRREPQVADRWMGVRYAQVHPGPVSDLEERDLDARHGALLPDVDGRRFPVGTTAAGPLRRHRTDAAADGNQQLEQQQ